MNRRQLIKQGAPLLLGITAFPWAALAGPAPALAANLIAAFRRQLQETAVLGTSPALLEALCTPQGEYQWADRATLVYRTAAGQYIRLRWDTHGIRAKID